MLKEFQLESRKITDHLEDIDVDWRLILKCTFKKEYLEMKTGFIWFTVAKSGGLI
jgi:hypothetical protein